MQTNNRNSARRLLLLLPFPPRLDAANGGGRVMAQLITGLATRHRVAVLYLRGAGEAPIDAALVACCELVEEVARPSGERGTLQGWLYRARVTGRQMIGLSEWVTDWAVPAYAARVRVLTQTWQPDIVQVEFHVMGQYLGSLDPCSAPRVLTQHEPGTEIVRERWRSQRGYAKLKLWLDLLAWQRFERMLMRKVDAVVVFTERDRENLSRLSQKTPIIRIPLGTALPEQPLDPAGTQALSLLFVGSFVHPPNVDAAKRLINTILPLVHQWSRDVKLCIVGSDPPQEIQQMASDTVIVTGFVPDVAPYLNEAALVVAPLSLGGGMRVKVLEAMAAGKALVASPLAVEGLDLQDGAQCVVADSDAAFGAAIIELLADPEKRIAMAMEARRWAVANLGWEQSIAQYETLYQHLLNRDSQPTEEDTHADVAAV